MSDKPKGTSNRGFASMDPEKQRAIASKGGSSVPASKRPFAQDHRLAAEAGRKGGENSHGGKRAAPAPGQDAPQQDAPQQHAPQQDARPHDTPQQGAGPDGGPPKKA